MDHRAAFVAYMTQNGKSGCEQIGSQLLRYRIRSNHLGIISIMLDFSTVNRGYVVFRGDYSASFSGKTFRDFILPPEKVQEGFRLCNQLTLDHALCRFILDENHVIRGSLDYVFGSCFEPAACYKLARHLALHLEQAYLQMRSTFPFLP